MHATARIPCLFLWSVVPRGGKRERRRGTLPDTGATRKAGVLVPQRDFAVTVELAKNAKRAYIVAGVAARASGVVDGNRAVDFVSEKLAEPPAAGSQQELFWVGLAGRGDVRQALRTGIGRVLTKR